jgi:hypothetical protein
MRREVSTYLQLYKTREMVKYGTRNSEEERSSLFKSKKAINYFEINGEFH